MVTSEQVSELAHSFEADSVSPPTCTTSDRSNTSEKSDDGDNTEEDVPTAAWSDPSFLPEPVQPRDSKPSHYSAHETRMSLAQAFAHNAETKIEFLEAILEEEKRQWNENHAILKLQMLDDLQERRTARKQELLIELIRQQKRPEEITMFMKLAE
ncbi:hypothetical protein PPTG_05878 [Phytophthora nicotianae INRA-310]|uniref:Uncharacterized protein n=1 Tax=Phytophthora nicotianae (strain INRA-310) TaxID=761204 RepID=W2QWT7_PHYN3|nr:hypothetical protein PPTG_05878 [Phytophthora nicotianae INRA-310]ETN16735.1 hypothetical protein PPTG_05878 [Phytophthora nicotianae INRA-310]